MLSIKLQRYSPTCGGVSGGLAQIWIYDPYDFNWTQIAPVDGVNQPYSAVALRAGTGATATATVASGAVTAINVTAGGSGYPIAPTVVITGAGTGAAATANISGGVVVSVTVTAPGTGYTSAPTISFTGGSATAAGGARMFPINFIEFEAELKWTETRKACSVSYDTQLLFGMANLSQLITQWNESVDAAGCCSHVGAVALANSGKMFVLGELFVNSTRLAIPLRLRQDGSAATTGKLLDDENKQDTVLKGMHTRSPYEYSGDVQDIIDLE